MKIGAVSYLNTKPLVYQLEQIAPQASVLFDLPSRLADRLATGELDVALIPSIEFFRHPDYTIISDACIGCRREVLSVKLLSRVPFAQIRTLALDEGSRTSVALTRILLKQRFGVVPQTRPFPIGSTAEAMETDAVLVIGDRAIHASDEVFAEHWDLGQEWCNWSGLPFVFAMWVAHRQNDLNGLETQLMQARDLGVQNLPAIAESEAAEVGLSPQVCLTYLRDNLYFYLGEREQEGLQLFYDHASELDSGANRRKAAPRWSKPNWICGSMIQQILEKAVAGERLTREDGLELLQSHELAAIGRAANEVSLRLHPETYRTYNIDRNINYTNICTAVCDFCAFYRGPKSDEGYVLPRGELLKKVEETVALGGQQILMQGGLHPEFKLEWYEELLQDIKTNFPTVNIHGFSPPEIHHFTKIEKAPLKEVLQRLQAAGLGSLPGGGAEILVDRVRHEITRGKVLTDDWLNVMRVWHELGGKSSGTMMMGHVETLAERVEHLHRLRQLQDETGGFNAFICWTFQPDNTDMSDITRAGAVEYLKTQAVARLYLDNFRNIQSSWVTQGLKIGQLAMLFGANDMGSLMIEENVVAEAGTVHFLTLEEIRDSIKELGFVPRQRNVHYQLVDLELEQFAIEANQKRDQQRLDSTTLHQIST